jgi:hypothetical protein
LAVNGIQKASSSVGAGLGVMRAFMAKILSGAEGLRATQHNPATRARLIRKFNTSRYFS